MSLLEKRDNSKTPHDPSNHHVHRVRNIQAVDIVEDDALRLVEARRGLRALDKTRAGITGEGRD